MNRQEKKQRWKSDLCVKEIILPCSQNLKRNPDLLLNSDSESAVGHENILNSLVEIGDHEVHYAEDLKFLEKKPLEDYFEGIKEKKQMKRKIKKKGKTCSLSDFVHALQQSDVHDVQGDSSKEKECLSKEDTVENKLLQINMYKYQKMKEYREQKSHIKQKMEVENYLERIENLQKFGWRHQLKQTHSDSQGNKISKNQNKISFSIISRKYWNDDKDVFLRKNESKQGVQTTDKCEDSRQQPSFEKLDEHFGMLVFVDEDSDEPAS